MTRQKMTRKRKRKNHLDLVDQVLDPHDVHARLRELLEQELIALRLLGGAQDVRRLDERSHLLVCALGFPVPRRPARAALEALCASLPTKSPS